VPANVTHRLREIAETRMRYGCRRIHVLLGREGWQVKVKRVRRLYELEDLQIRLFMLQMALSGRRACGAQDRD